MALKQGTSLSVCQCSYSLLDSSDKVHFSLSPSLQILPSSSSSSPSPSLLLVSYTETPVSRPSNLIPGIFSFAFFFLLLLFVQSFVTFFSSFQSLSFSSTAYKHSHSLAARLQPAASVCLKVKSSSSFSALFSVCQECLLTVLAVRIGVIILSPSLNPLSFFSSSLAFRSKQSLFEWNERSLVS